tara:strand:+ start:2794 stop:2988 length:195 start_codon:yes stop_codon:yes gene_type:complete
MNKEKEDMNGLGEPDKIIDMGELDNTEQKDVDVDLDDVELSEEEEELLKKKLEQIRKNDPFIYR